MILLGSTHCHYPWNRVFPKILKLTKEWSETFSYWRLVDVVPHQHELASWYELPCDFADVAEKEGMQISLHPDDPPWGLLGIVIIIISIIIISRITANTTIIVNHTRKFSSQTAFSSKPSLSTTTFSCRPFLCCLITGRLPRPLQSPPLPKVIMVIPPLWQW